MAAIIDGESRPRRGRERERRRERERDRWGGEKVYDGSMMRRTVGDVSVGDYFGVSRLNHYKAVSRARTSCMLLHFFADRCSLRRGLLVQ